MGLRVCMLAVTALTVTVLVRQWKADFVPFIRLAVTLLFSFLVITAAAPIVSYLEALLENTAASKYATVLIKGLGISILTQCCSEICRECGEGGIGSGVELIGKIELLLLCLPLMNEILTLAKELMTIGGAS